MFDLHLEKRLHQSALTRLGVSAAAVMLTLVMGGLFLFASGINVVAAYQWVWTDVLTQSLGWEDLLVKVTPLLLTGTWGAQKCCHVTVFSMGKTHVMICIHERECYGEESD
jgi:ABC-type uncharacterized transport system permease subunit